MIVPRHVVTECRDDRVFAPTILGPGAWAALSLALLARAVFDLLPAP